MCPHISWRIVFFTFGLMGFLWTFIWIVSYRDTNTSITTGSTADEEQFIPSSPKVFILFVK